MAIIVWIFWLDIITNKLDSRLNYIKHLKKKENWDNLLSSWNHMINLSVISSDMNDKLWLPNILPRGRMYVVKNQRPHNGVLRNSTLQRNDTWALTINWNLTISVWHVWPEQSKRWANNTNLLQVSVWSRVLWLIVRIQAVKSSITKSTILFLSSSGKILLRTMIFTICRLNGLIQLVGVLEIFKLRCHNTLDLFSYKCDRRSWMDIDIRTLTLYDIRI